MIKTIWTAATLLLLTTLSPGAEETVKPGIGLSYQGAYSSNIFMNASAIDDYVSTLQADLNFSIDKVNLYLDASTFLFADNPDFNSFQIEPGLEFLFPMKNRNALFLSLSYKMLSFGELYTDFNYSGPGLSTSIKYYLSPSMLLKGAYQFEYRSYGNFRSFDFHNHTLFLEISRFFDTQTTLRLSGGFNYRFYPHIEDTVLSETEYVTEYSYGFGRHGNPPANLYQATSHSMSVPNLYAMLGLSQGIGTRVGLSGELEYRYNFRGLEDAETLIQNAYIVYPYNDNYLWDGLRMRLRITAIILNEWSLSGSLSYFIKGYPGIYVMDDLGLVVEPYSEREDKMVMASLNLSKRFRKLELNAGFGIGNNRSNDPFFTYNMVTAYAGIGVFF